MAGGEVERRPLAGLRVVVTRALEQAGELVAALESAGAEVLVYPMIRIVAPADPGPLRRAARSVGAYDWVVFTSVNGVERFFEELEAAGLGAGAIRGRIACIGPATATAVERHGARADLVPQRYVAEALLDELCAGRDLRGTRILLPRAAEARAVLPEGLAARGAIVEEVEAYRSVPDAVGAGELRRRLEAGEVDVLTFTASSTVRSFLESVGKEVGRAKVAVIGPVAAETARQGGLRVDIEASEHTIPGLVRALALHFGREREA